MNKYHPALVALHWLLAFLIIGGLIAGGFGLANTPNSDPFKLFSLKMHMSIGTGILVLMIVRLIVKFATKSPPACGYRQCVAEQGRDCGALRAVRRCDCDGGQWRGYREGGGAVRHCLWGFGRSAAQGL